MTRLFNSFVFRSVGLASALALGNTVALASPIYSCAVSPEKLSDGLLYTFDGESMTPLKSSSPLEGEARTSKTLFFVVKTFGEERAGAIVIKTARVGPALSQDRPFYGRVQLKRRSAPSSCNATSGYSGSVSTQAYEAYHDLGHDHGDRLDRSEDGTVPLDALKRFHTTYEASDYSSPGNSRCRATDDKFGLDGVYEARNNRSQFSFTTGIVDHGIEGAFYRDAVKGPVIWVASQIFSPVFAEEPGLRERRVEIKPYQTAGGIACIPIRIYPRGKSQILRINDLDRRRLVGYDSGRVKEFRLEDR
jgi:hypothetical protein